MEIIRIDDPADPRVAPYLSIRERDLAGRQGRFIAEGKVVLNVLFSAARFEAESVLVLENRLPGLADTLRLAPASMPVFAAPQAVMDAIAGFHIHRGILAIGRKRDADDPEALIASLPERALVVVLVGLSNHDNVGAIFRNAAAFGADAVLLDETCCDPLYRKAIRVSVGAALKVPFAIAADAGSIVDAARIPPASARSRCRPRARPTSAMRHAPTGWRSISARKATGCPTACCRGSRPSASAWPKASTA